MKKIFVILYFIFSISIYSQSTNDLIFSGKLSTSEKTTDIPAVFTEDGWIFIECNIDGKNYLFLYDTGAMITILSPEIANKSENNSKISLENPSGKKTDTELILKNIRLNNFNFENIACAVVDLSSFENQSCRKIDGIIGTNLLRLANWKIEPSVGKILSSTEPFKPAFNNPGIDIHYYNKLLPLVEILLDNKKQWVLIDTGSTSYFELNNDFVKNSKLKKKKKIVGSGISITINEENERTTELMYIDELNLQGISFKNVPTLISKDKPILGSKFFAGYSSIFNFSENKLYLDFREESFVFDSLKNFDINFCLNKKNELTVCFLWDSAKHNVKYGDKVIKVNGKPINILNHKTYCQIKEDMIFQERVQVTILSNGKELNLDLVKTKR